MGTTLSCQNHYNCKVAAYLNEPIAFTELEIMEKFTYLASESMLPLLYFTSVVL